MSDKYIENILVPQLGESISEVTVGAFSAKENDSVAEGDMIVELETDKVSLEVTAPSAGVIKNIQAKTGDILSQGATICSISKSDNVTQTPQTERVTQTPQASNTNSSPDKQSSLINSASPAARQILSNSNISVNDVQATGKNSIITRSDAMTAASALSSDTNQGTAEPAATPAAASPESTTTASPATPAPSSGPAPEQITPLDRHDHIEPMSNLRITIAKRLKDSQDTAAILTTFNEVDMSKIIKIRSKYGEEFKQSHEVKLGFMSFFVKAAVHSLKQYPIINASIDGSNIVTRNYQDIGIAVGTEKGLIVPILRNAQSMSFTDIEGEILRLSDLAQSGKLQKSDLTGGTFTITNGGIYGSMLSTPIINPPQSAILGMHKIEKRPVVIDDKVTIRPIMYLALSYDHRLIDGREAVKFLDCIKKSLEDPYKILLHS